MSLRAFTVAVLSIVFMPVVAAGQARDTSGPALDRLSLQIAAGPLLQSGGYNVSAGFGFSPISRLDLLVSVERDHLPFQRDTFGGSTSITRGGTFTAVSAELRASVLPPDRLSPYGFAGIGGGKARPTVNESFPTPVENDLRIVYFGGGLRVPMRAGLSIFGEARAMLALEGDEGLMGVWPVRAGLAWRF